MNISGATVLVAGGSSGLGAACVSRLADENAHVVIADLRPPAETPHRSTVFCQADVTDEVSLRAAIELAGDRFGSVQGVVVCAGIIHGERILGRDGLCDLACFQRVINVNLVGTFNVLRLAASVMQHNSPDDQGERGVIVMTSSVAAFEGQIGQTAYAAAKGGVAALTLPAARELARVGIRVITIAPGIFETPMMQQVTGKHYDALQSQTLFPPRFGQPDEFASLVVHCLRNRMLNGTVVRLDGGMRMTAK